MTGDGSPGEHDATVAADPPDAADLERRLLDMRRRFELAMTHAPIGMAISVIDGPWLAVNPALCELFGYSEQQLLDGRSFADLTHPDDLDAELALHAATLAGDHDHYSLDKRYLHADGHIVWTTTSVSLVRDELGTPRYFVAQCLDVTERVRIEEELRDTTRRLQESDDLRVAFLRATSHELRTPLTVVAGIAETLLYRQDQIDPRRSHDLLERMVAHTERLRRLIEDLLDVDRLSTGLVEARRDPLELDALVLGVLPTIDVSQHRLVTRLAPVSIAGDRAKLERVVANLLGNAVRHTPVGSTIRVSTWQCDDAAMITVIDDGAGIPDGHEQRIFDPFVQGAASRDDPRPGTGLGLTLVRELTVLHGGSVSASNRPAGGACFEVALPMAAGPISATAPEPPAAHPDPATRR